MCNMYRRAVLLSVTGEIVYTRISVLPKDGKNGPTIIDDLYYNGGRSCSSMGSWRAKNSDIAYCIDHFTNDPDEDQYNKHATYLESVVDEDIYGNAVLVAYKDHILIDADINHVHDILYSARRNYHMIHDWWILRKLNTFLSRFM